MIVEYITCMFWQGELKITLTLPVKTASTKPGKGKREVIKNKY
jgi:hypothetical protein